MPQATTPCLLDAKQMEVHLQRLCREIVAAFGDDDTIALLGIRTRGLFLAERLKTMLDAILLKDIPLGVLDITLYRDDLDFKPPRALEETSIPAGGIDGCLVILVDDVLYTGRSVRSALDALRYIGRPTAIQLAVLVDRGHRELPLRADYVGKNVPTSRAENVKVRLVEDDGVEGIWIAPEGGPPR